MKTITLTARSVAEFPVEARWRSCPGSKSYASDVFPSLEAAKNYLTGRFGACRFIDKTSA